MRSLLPALFLAAGCGLDQMGTGPVGNDNGPGPTALPGAEAGALADATLDVVPPADDASSGFDAGPSPPPDAGPDAPTTCNFYCGTQCVASCSDCPDKLACGNTCVADCTACNVGGQAKAFECFKCPIGQPPQGSCEDQTGYCFTQLYVPCGCATLGGPSVALCPSQQQVCEPGIVGTCHTCGEGSTTGLGCKNGKSCTTDAGPKCDG